MSGELQARQSHLRTQQDGADLCRWKMRGLVAASMASLGTNPASQIW